MSASTALVKDFGSFKRLRNFSFSLSILITFLMLIFITPEVFYYVTLELIKLPDNIANLTHTATIILIPWPGAIGYRRFYQGILIRNNLTRRVAYGTIIRLLTMSATAVLLFLFSDTDGVMVGAYSLSAAVVLEAIASRITVNKVIRKIKTEKDNSDLLYKDIFYFYYPLALTSIIGLGVQPVVTFFVSQSRMPIESLAVLPVVTSFVFIFRAMGLSFQEVVIALAEDKKENVRCIKKFAFILAVSLVCILSITAFTPLSDIWLRDVSGLSEFLTEFALAPLMIMSVFPAFTVLISYQRGILVNSNRTSPITVATVIEFLFIIISMLISVRYFSFVGAVAATLSFVIGRIMANVYLNFSVYGTGKKRINLKI